MALVFIVIRGWVQEIVLIAQIDKGLHSLNFLQVPSEEALGFLLNLPRCGAEGKGKIEVESCQ